MPVNANVARAACPVMRSQPMPPSRSALSVVLTKNESLEPPEAGIEEREDAERQETEGNGTDGQRPEGVMDEGS